MAESPEIVRFGCIRCKRTRRTAQIDAAAERTMEAILFSTYDFLHREALELGVEVPDEFRQKMVKWARKRDIIPPAPPARPPTPYPERKKPKYE